MFSVCRGIGVIREVNYLSDYKKGLGGTYETHNLPQRSHRTICIVYCRTVYRSRWKVRAQWPNSMVSPQLGSQEMMPLSCKLWPLTCSVFFVVQPCCGMPASLSKKASHRLSVAFGMPTSFTRAARL